MTNLTLRKKQSDLEPLINMVLDALGSAHSRRAYAFTLNNFLAWHQLQGRPTLNKATVQAYKTHLQNSGLSAATVNQRLCAIRKLAVEAADNGLLDQNLASGIKHVEGLPKNGIRAGRWLTLKQAQLLINAPDISNMLGLRDRAILAVMIGAGLRRSEVVALNFSHIAQRDGRWAIVDLVGKGNHVRTVPIPSWAKLAIDQWTAAAGISDGAIFRPLTKAGRRLDGERMGTGVFLYLVRKYSTSIGVTVSPHDLRRTYAKLAHKGGAPLEQIQLSLGHLSMRTTEIYLNVEQDLTMAPCDVIGLRLEAEQ